MTDPQLWATLDMLLRAAAWLMGLGWLLGLMQYSR